MHLCPSSTFKFSDFLSFWSKSVPLRVLSLFCAKDAENLFLKLSQVKRPSMYSLQAYVF